MESTPDGLDSDKDCFILFYFIYFIMKIVHIVRLVTKIINATENIVIAIVKFLIIWHSVYFTLSKVTLQF